MCPEVLDAFFCINGLITHIVMHKIILIHQSNVYQSCDFRLMGGVKSNLTGQSTVYHTNNCLSKLSVKKSTKHHCWDNFVYAPCQWETTLQCNVVSHWLGAYTKSSLLLVCLSVRCNSLTRGLSAQRVNIPENVFVWFHQHHICY